jgi:hypothetical protein
VYFRYKSYTVRSYFIFSLIGVFIACSALNAQGVFISTQALGQPHQSSVLELSDTTKGFLVTRLTSAQRNAIVNPAEGLLIYNTDIRCFEAWFPSGWSPVACECNSAPPTPGTVTGYASVCPSQTAVQYSIAAVLGASSYTWTVPVGATVVSGQGTSSILVDYGSNAGSGVVEVVAVNGCGVSAAQQLPVSIQLPNAQFTTQPSTLSVNNPILFVPNTIGTHDWAFQNGSPSTSQLAQPSVQWSATGTVTISHIFFSNPQCSDTVVQNSTVINCPPGTQTFSFTGGVQSFTVPSCVSQLNVTLRGAQGENSACAPNQGGNGGLGAEVTGVLNVLGGAQLWIYVGGQTGYNGGGLAPASPCAGCRGGNGGGASDIRSGGTALSNRVAIAGGGGGGGGGNSSYRGGDGGSGGSTGGNASPSNGCSTINSGGGGTGGTASAGGVAGGGCGGSGSPGTLGSGGNGVNTDWCSGGGGGGGFYGGGGGGSCCGSGGGGGGSSSVGSLNNGLINSNFQSGNGQVVLSW